MVTFTDVTSIFSSGLWWWPSFQSRWLLEWRSQMVGDGLSVAGAVLPAVGFAILLRYLPVKKHFAYLILGFVITALLTTLFGNIQLLGTSVAGLDKTLVANFNSMPMLAIALIGLAFSLYLLQT